MKRKNDPNFSFFSFPFESVVAMHAPSHPSPWHDFMLSKKPYFSETGLDSMKHVLIFDLSFSHVARMKCNSNQCNGTTPTHGSLQINQFHNGGIEESKEKNQEISR